MSYVCISLAWPDHFFPTKLKRNKKRSGHARLTTYVYVRMVSPWPSHYVSVHGPTEQLKIRHDCLCPVMRDHLFKTVHAHHMLYDSIGMCLCISCLPHIWFFSLIAVVFVHYKSSVNLLFCVLYRL